MAFYASTDVDQLKRAFSYYKRRAEEAEGQVSVLTDDLQEKTELATRLRDERDRLLAENACLKIKQKKKATTPSSSFVSTDIDSSPAILLPDFYEKLRAMSVNSFNSAQSTNSSPSRRVQRGTMLHTQIESPSPIQSTGEIPIMLDCPQRVTPTKFSSPQLSSPFSPLRTSIADHSKEPITSTDSNSFKNVGQHMTQAPSWSFDRLFQEPIIWAKEYAILPIDTAESISNRPMSSFKALIDSVTTLTASSSIDSFLQSVKFRPIVIAALINNNLIGVLAGSSFDDFDCDQTPELRQIRAMISKPGKKPAPAEVDALLRRQATLWTSISDTHAFWNWAYPKMMTLAKGTFSLLSSMIPIEDHQVAYTALEAILIDTLEISLQMKKQPSEWFLFSGSSGDRWIPGTMDQQDSQLSADPRLNQNNGFYFVVHFGIAPSITEMNYSTGAVRTSHRHRQQVILMENPSQRRESGAKDVQQKKSRASFGFRPASGTYSK